MNNERFQLLSVGPNLVGRLTVEEAALILGFQKHDIPELVRAGLLKYLGRPSPSGVLVEEGRPKHKPKPSNTVKYLSAAEVLAHAMDTVWLSRGTRLIYGVWAAKNARRTTRKQNRPDYLFGSSLAAHV